MVPVYFGGRKRAFLEAAFLFLSAAAALYGNLSPGQPVAVATADGGRGVSVVVIGLYLLGRDQWKHGALVATVAALGSVGLAYGSLLYEKRTNGDDSESLSYAHQFRIIIVTMATAGSLFMPCFVRLPSFARQMSTDFIALRERLLCSAVFAVLLASEVAVTLPDTVLDPRAAILLSHFLFSAAATVAFHARPAEYSQKLRIDLSEVSQSRG